MNEKQLNAAYERVISALKLNMGIDNKMPLEVPAEITFIESTSTKTGQITDLELAKAGEDMLQIDIKNARKERIPSVMLYGSYGKTGYGYDEEPHDFLDFYDKSFVGLKIDIPLADFSRRKKINRIKMERDNAGLRAALLEDKISMETTNARNRLEVASAQIESARLREASAQRIYNKTLMQHKMQIASLTDVLMADTDLRKAQQDELDAIVEYLKAHIELEKLTGNIPVK